MHAHANIKKLTKCIDLLVTLLYALYTGILCVEIWKTFVHPSTGRNISEYENDCQRDCFICHKPRAWRRVGGDRVDVSVSANLLVADTWRVNNCVRGTWQVFTCSIPLKFVFSRKRNRLPSFRRVLELLHNSACIIIIIIIIIDSVGLSRNIGCLWVLSTSVYRLLRNLVHSSSYPLHCLPIFSSYFSVFLSSCFLEDSKIVHSLLSLHLLFLMCDQSI